MWMILSQGVFKEAVTEVHNGSAGGHLGRIKTLRKNKSQVLENRVD